MTEHAVLRQAAMADADAIWRIRYSVGESTLAPGRLCNEDLRRELEDTGPGWVVEVDGNIGAFATGNARSGKYPGFVLRAGSARPGTRL